MYSPNPDHPSGIIPFIEVCPFELSGVNSVSCPAPTVQSEAPSSEGESGIICHEGLGRLQKLHKELQYPFRAIRLALTLGLPWTPEENRAPFPITYSGPNWDD